MRSIAFIVTAGVVAVACGGKVTSVDGSKTVNSLSPADQTQLCNDVYNYYTSSLSQSDFARLVCALNAGIPSGDCQTNFNDCVAKQSAITFPPPDCNAFSQSIANCNTTVGQFTDCVQQGLSAEKAFESKLPYCSQSDFLAAIQQEQSQLSATCVNLLQTCPATLFTTTTVINSDGGADGG